MNASNIGSNVYVSSALSSLVEFPAYIVAVRTCEWPSIGRKGSTAGGLFLGGLCCVLSVFALPDEPDSTSFVALFLVFFGKCAVALSFATVFLYAAELFPTSIRNSAMGLQSLSSRVGGMLSSIVASWGEHSKALPLIIFGLPCLVVGIWMFSALPETRGQAMMDTVDDMPTVNVGMIPASNKRYGELEEARTPNISAEQIGRPNSNGACFAKD